MFPLPEACWWLCRYVISHTSWCSINGTCQGHARRRRSGRTVGMSATVLMGRMKPNGKQTAASWHSSQGQPFSPSDQKEHGRGSINDFRIKFLRNSYCLTWCGPFRQKDVALCARLAQPPANQLLAGLWGRHPWDRQTGPSLCELWAQDPPGVQREAFWESPPRSCSLASIWHLLHSHLPSSKLS